MCIRDRMVTVKMNGKHEVLSITIKPEAVDPDDVETVSYTHLDVYKRQALHAA